MMMPVAVEMKGQWDEWCIAVADGKLDAVATEILETHDIPLQDVSPAPPTVPGGTAASCTRNEEAYKGVVVKFFVT